MRLFRIVAALGAAGVILGMAALVAAQCAGLVQRSVALHRELSVVRGEVADLRLKKAEQDRTIRRLRDPAGTIPEIHDRLRLVAPNEAMIYVKGAATPVPLP